MRDAIVVTVPDVDNAADVTETHLAAITSLSLRSAGITALNSGDFSGMTGLTQLNLYGNQLSSLPDGIFEGLTALTTLRLGGNTVDPMPITVSLEKVAEGEVKAVAPTGAPFEIVVPISVTNGSISDGTTTLTISTGHVESDTVTVTRTADTIDAVSTNIGRLPSIPLNHYGYVLSKSDTLPLEVISAEPENAASVAIPENAAPVFTDGTDTTRTIAENSDAGVNIGTTVAATDADDDTLTYSLGGLDAASFDIDSSSGQLQTSAALDFEDQSSYSVIVSVSDDNGGSDSINATINVKDVVDLSTPLSERTSQVRTGIVRAITIYPQRELGRDVRSANDVGDRHLLLITSLPLAGKGITSLQNGDFSGLSNLKYLYLTLNSLRSLPSDVFDGLSSLTHIYLAATSLNSLPSDVFSGLSSLIKINLGENSLRSLPSDIFDGLSSLEELLLDENPFSSLPDGLFEGLTSLIELDVSRRDAASLRDVTASLTKVTDGEFKATIHTAAPFDIMLPVSATNGTIVGGATTITVSKGNVESDTLTVTRTSDSSAVLDAVNVDIGDTLPAIPSSHSGYHLVKSNDLPLEVLPFVDRTPVFVDGSSTSRSVEENTDAGQRIGDAVLATPFDAEDTLTYTLGGTDADSFSINSRNGYLKTNAALDYETKSSYSVTVTATDDNSFSSTITVTIDVTDVDEAPQFSSRTARRSVEENTAADRNIGSPVSATPYTSGTPLTYTLGGTDADSFGIDSATGRLKTSAALDYETKSSYSVTITATDNSASVPFSSTINVRINITNVNEAPQFASDTTTRSVDENTARGERIGDPVSATDEDSTAATLTYTIGGTNVNKFRINGNTGQLKAHGALDYEGKTSYSVRVIVRDTWGLSDRIDVTINVNDLFDESTRLSERTSEVSDAIVEALSDVNSANDVTDAHLATITSLSLTNDGVASLKNGDFSGLSALETLHLDDNSLTTLPSNVFDGMSNLKEIDLSSNDITTLPANVFYELSNLEKVDLSSNDITTLLSNFFYELSNLEKIDLSSNDITTLPANVFGRRLSNVKEIDLSSNDMLSQNALTALPSDVFDGVSRLEVLNISQNSLSSLPTGIFNGLTSLNELNLSGNATDPLPITVEVKKSGSDGVKIVIETRAPFGMGVRVRLENATFDRNISTASVLIIYTGQRESARYTVTRDAEATDAVTAEITSVDDLPNLPDNHSGYTLVPPETALVVYQAQNVQAAPSSGQQIPDATEFLPNFPNPFNPETWIPYQLAKPADVTLTIYDIRGVVVRQLALGHQKAGFYTNRSRAAHWDGRNNFAEKVATGIYFCTFKAGDFTATRKLLIRK